MKRGRKQGRRFAGIMALFLLVTTAAQMLQGQNVCAQSVWASQTAAETAGAETQQDAKTTAPANPVYDETSDTTTWSYVYFGSYPQTEVTGEALTEAITGAEYDASGDAIVNGQKYRRLYKAAATKWTNKKNESYYIWNGRDYAYFRYEPIRWRVLENDGETLFLLADEVLDCKMYNQNDGKVTWSTSFARKWLNGYDGCNVEGLSFYTMAFDNAQRAAMQTTHITGSDNPFNGIDGGMDTDDKIFLLSVREAMNPQYGFADELISYTKTRRMEPTDYAFAMGAWKSTYNEECYGNAFWLLRSPGAYQQAVSLVYNYGHVYQDGYYADERCYGICPAVKISADSTAWSMEEPQAAYGDVTQDGSVTTDDAQRALMLAIGLVRPSINEKWYADADGDNTLTLTDARLILRCALKIDTQLPVQAIDSTLPEPVPYVYEAKEVTWPTQEKTEASGTVWIAADSIAASHRKSGEQPLYGWGELIGDYFDRSVQFHNEAVSGSSTLSFTQSNGYKTMQNNISKGDYLLISFGHNDERASLTLYADPFGGADVVGSYKWNLKNLYIDPALEAGAQPVLITPVVRRYFENGTFVAPQLHTAYAEAMKELSAEYAAHGINVPVIDLHGKMSALYAQLGDEGTKKLHGMSNGVSDNTHFCKAGAEQACEYMIEEMKAQGLDLCVYLKEQ